MHGDPASEPERSVQNVPARQQIDIEEVLGCMSEGVLITDARGRLIAINPAALRLHGFESTADVPPTMEAAMSRFELRRPNGEPLPGEQWLVRRALNGECITDVELEVQRTDTGQRFIVSSSCGPVRDAAGNITHAVLTVRDITGRRRFESALAESEARYRELADSVPQLVWTATPDGSCDYVNRQWVEYTGMPESTAHGSGWLEAVHPEDRLRAREKWRAARGIAEYDIEFRLRAADGSYRWFKTRGRPIRDERGDIVRWFGACTDIEDERRTADEIRRSERHLRNVLDSLFAYVSVLTPDGILLQVNRALLDAAGIEASDVAGKPFWEAYWWSYSAEAQAQVRDAIERARQGRSSRYDVDVRMAGGRLMCIAFALVPMFDEEGRVTHLIASAVDITERKRVERELRESRERLQAALDASGTGTYQWNMRTGEAEWDENCSCVFGFPPRVTPTSAEQFLAVVHPEDQATIQEDLRNSVERGANFDREFRVVWPDGSVHWVADKGRAYLGPDGKPAYMTGACVDITDHRRAEEALLQAKKLESLAVLAGGMAHDFNNLLVGIIGNASLLLQSAPPDAGERGPLQAIVAAGARAADLIRQILAYTGQGRFVVERVDLSRVVRELGGALQSSVPPGVKLVLDLADDVPLVEADRTQIHQVVLNLVRNAAEAIPDGKPGTIIVRTRAEQLDRAALEEFRGDAAPGTYVALEVRDNGRGMDEATVSKIFDPFFTTKFPGRGLGLSAVQGIVRASRGALKVRSAPGKGTTFTVLFPWAVAASH